MANQIVAQIYKGYKITVEGVTYEVLGNSKMRGTYFYIIRDIKTGKKASMRREMLLSLQASGDAVVSL